MKTLLITLFASRGAAAATAPAEYRNARPGEVVRIPLRRLVPVTDGRARRLPPDARGSELLAGPAGPNLDFRVVLNGLIGRDGRAFGFAQARFTVANAEVPLGRDRARVGFRFRVLGTPGTRWQLVLTTDVSEARGDGETLTYQAEFEPGLEAREIFVPLDAFVAVARGEPIPGEPAPGRLDYPENRLRVRALGLQLTRGGIPGGRDRLDPFEARLVVEGAEILLDGPAAP